MLLGATSPAAQAPGADEQAKALAALKDYAVNYTGRLPDFVCTQVTRRTYYPNVNLPEHPHHDAIDEQVTFASHKESYVVTRVDGRPVANVGHDQLGGMFSSGEFGTLLSNTFDPKARAEFHWQRSVNRNGRRVYVFAFRVPHIRGYGLEESKRILVVPYKGLVYSDAETGAVVRIEMECEIPKNTEYKELEITLDYKPAQVAGKEFLLPSHYHMHSRRQVAVSGSAKGRDTVVAAVTSETFNEADYKNYRRFDADSSVTFDGDATPKP